MITFARAIFLLQRELLFGGSSRRLLPLYSVRVSSLCDMWKHTLVVVLLCSTQPSLSVPTTESESKEVPQQTTSDVITPAASTPDYQRHHENINQLGDDEPISYDGAQVWRLGFADTRDKNAVSDLQHNFGN